MANCWPPVMKRWLHCVCYGLRVFRTLNHQPHLTSLYLSPAVNRSHDGRVNQRSSVWCRHCYGARPAPFLSLSLNLSSSVAVVVVRWWGRRDASACTGVASPAFSLSPSLMPLSLPSSFSLWVSGSRAGWDTTSRPWFCHEGEMGFSPYYFFLGFKSHTN